MSPDRYMVFGLARAGRRWFSELGRWSTTGVAPIQFVRCVSGTEVGARLTAGQRCSALLADPTAPGFGRDLIEAVVTTGACVILVGPAHSTAADLGAAAELTEDFSPNDLARVLRDHAPPTGSATPSASTPEPTLTRTRGRLIAVTGPGGTGASTIAMAIAQGLAAAPGSHGMVLLADFALDADLAMLHDTGDVVPGLQELTEAHQTGRLAVEEVRASTFDTGHRGYHLLLGLRHHRDWTVVRRRAFLTTLEGLTSSYRIVVADVDHDVEGEHETGSSDVEDRNLIARGTVAQADLVVCVGNPTTKGLHALARSMRRLTGAGVDPATLVPVLTQAPRRRRLRAEATSTLAVLTDSIEGSAAIANPVLVPHCSDVETAIREGDELPPAVVSPLGTELSRRLRSLPPTTERFPSPEGPELVSPGSLGSWPEDAT